MADYSSYEPAHELESNDSGQRTEAQYDAFVKKSLCREVKKFIRDTGRREAHETLFSEMDAADVSALEDSQALEYYGGVDSGFKVLEHTVAVHNDLIHDALSRIGERERGIILMSYWLKMSDLEIADETGIPRRTINSIKHSAHQHLRKILEDEGYGANNFFPKDDT
jgi:RNA polymerase sigma factor (sigma-70 family)